MKMTFLPSRQLPFLYDAKSNSEIRLVAAVPVPAGVKPLTCGPLRRGPMSRGLCQINLKLGQGNGRRARCRGNTQESRKQEAQIAQYTQRVTVLICRPSLSI